MESQIPTKHQRTRQETSSIQPENDELENAGPPGVISREKQTYHGASHLVTIWWREKWISLLVFSLIMSGTLANAFLTPPVYQAETILLVGVDQNDEQEPLLNIGRIQSLSPGGRTLSNQVLLIRQSAAIADRVSHRLLQTAVQESVTLTVLSPPSTPDRQVTDVSNRLRKHYLRVDPVNEREVDAIQIRVRSRIPEEAALIANYFAEEYVESSREVRRSHIEASRQFLEQQISKTARVLQDNERQIEQFKTQEGATEFRQEEDRTRTRIAHLETLLDEAKIELQTQRAKLQTLENELNQVRPNLTIRVASGAEHEIERAQVRIAELELLLEQASARNALSSTDLSNSEELLQARAEIAHLRDIVLDLSKQYVNEMLNTAGIDIGIPGTGNGWMYVSQLRRQIVETKIAITGLQARVDALTQRSTEYLDKIKTFPGHEIQFARLQREQRLTEQTYLTLTERLQEVRMAGEAQIGSGEIVTPATVPEKPESPRKTRILSMGFLLAAVISIGTVSLMAKLNNRIYTPADMYTFGNKSITVIPDMKKKSSNGTEEIIPDKERVIGNLHGAGMEDAFKRLLLDITSGPDGKVPCTVLVTSAETGAGKSTTVMNLAITAGAVRLRTMILDADLYKPDLRPRLRNSFHLSLKEILHAPFSAFIDSDFETKIPYVYSITSPEPCRDAARLIGSRAFPVLLEHLKTRFDLILIDTPPALAVGEVGYLAACCDVTIVIARARSTRDEAFHQTLAELRSAGVIHLKTVLNRFDASREFGYRNTLRFRFQDYYRHLNIPENQATV